MENTQQNLGLLLSQEELWTVLKMLNIPSIPGCDVPADDSQPPEVMAMMYGTAEHSLLTRDIVRVTFDEAQPDTYQHMLDRRVVALVGSGAIAKSTITFTQQSINGITESAWLYFVPGLRVFHTVDMGISHRFDALTSGDMTLMAISSALQLDPGKQALDPDLQLEVNQQALMTAQQALAADDEQAAFDALQESGQSVESSILFIRLLKDVVSMGHVDMTVREPDKVTGFSVFSTAAQHYLFTPSGDNLHIQAASLVDITGHIVEWIKANTPAESNEQQ